MNPTNRHGFHRPARRLLPGLALIGATLALGGCMGTPAPLVVVEPSFVLDHVADQDTRTLAAWPVMAENDALADAKLRQRGSVAEYAFLEQ